MATESNDNTEKVIHFMNQLEQLGLQLKAARPATGLEKGKEDRHRGIRPAHGTQQDTPGPHRQMAPRVSGTHGMGERGAGKEIEPGL